MFHITMDQMTRFNVKRVVYGNKPIDNCAGFMSCNSDCNYEQVSVKSLVRDCHQP